MAGLLEKTCPWCTIVLVTLCMLCHTAVFVGNLSAADGIQNIGKGTGGWSNVGLSLADSFREEIDYAMSNMTSQMTQAINQIIEVQEMIDLALGQLGEEHQSLLQVSSGTDQPDLPVPLPEALNDTVQEVMDAMDAGNQQRLKNKLKQLAPQVMEQVGAGLDSLLDFLEPGLLKLGQWDTSFGDKVQAGVELFATTIDMVQKLFDQIMQQMNPPSDDPDLFEYMMHNTFTMFALTNSTAGIMVQDLQDAAEIYSINAIQGSKSEELFSRYDANKDAVIDYKEFAGFVNDDSVPFVMAVVLRQYSKRLSQISGRLRQAKLRDEVASTVVKYLQLVCAKNRTKVGWISQMLTNNTLPLAFTADVMRNLALAQDDPDVPTTADVGAVVVGTMTKLNPDTTMEAADLMANTTFWADEGFDPQDQPTCVERVSKWTSASLLETGSHIHLSKLHQQLGGQHEVQSLSLLAEGVDVVSANFGMMGRTLAEKNRHEYYQQQATFRKERYQMLHATETQRHYFNALLGGKMAASFDPQAVMATKSGVPARPETLLFAKWLSYNASDCAAEFQEHSFNYTGQSSSAMDAFATQIEGMVKKTQALMAMLVDYSGPTGVENLRQKIAQFVQKGTHELIRAIDSMGKTGSNNTSLLQTVALVDQPSGGQPSDTEFAQMVATLEELTAVLPAVVDNLKLARDEVSAVSATLDSVFDTFKNFGEPLFQKIATRYREIWALWFILMTIFTLGILYYGFWASGYCGGPKAKEAQELTEEEQEEADKTCYQRWCGWESWKRFLQTCCMCRRTSEEPNTFWDKCKCCWGSCCAGMSDCSETDLCFWSLILLGQLFVLVMFLVSLVLVIMAGVEMFIASGCASVYVLDDDTVCTEQLKVIQGWITTFDAGAPELPLAEVCSNKSLTTCKVIGEQMKQGAMLSVGGAVVVGVLTFQLLIDSAILHERARMRKLIDAGIKDGTLKDPEADDK